MIQFQENTQRNDRMKGRTDLFHRTLPAIAAGMASTNAVNWHFKVKDRVWSRSNQKFLHHSKKTSVYKLILKIHQNKIQIMPIFELANLKIIKKKLIPSLNLTSIQKISSFQLLILEAQSFWSPMIRLATPILGYTHPKYFCSTFNLQEFVSTYTCTKWG